VSAPEVPGWEVALHADMTAEAREELGDGFVDSYYAAHAGQFAVIAAGYVSDALAGRPPFTQGRVVEGFRERLAQHFETLASSTRHGFTEAAMLREVARIVREFPAAGGE
jgi:hypothetical protein